MSRAVSPSGNRARERKHDFAGACNELRSILAREVSGQWPHARFVEEYKRFCDSERYKRLTGPSRNWLCGMVNGAHAAVQSMLEVRHDFGDGVWRKSGTVPAGRRNEVVRTEFFWKGSEVMR